MDDCLFFVFVYFLKVRIHNVIISAISAISAGAVDGFIRLGFFIRQRRGGFGQRLAFSANIVNITVFHCILGFTHGAFYIFLFVIADILSVFFQGLSRCMDKGVTLIARL